MTAGWVPVTSSAFARMSQARRNESLACAIAELAVIQAAVKTAGPGPGALLYAMLSVTRYGCVRVDGDGRLAVWAGDPR